MSKPTLPHALIVRAPAKINLALEVLARRDDGYHDIDTVMSTLTLSDTVRIESAPALEVIATGPYAGAVPVEDDLAARAARTLGIAAGREPTVRITLEKRVPAAAGLGGGASDAGAVLRGLNRLWELGWSAERLASIGAEVGSDVPFFVHGGVAHCTGRGEIVEPLRDLKPPLRMFVLVPSVPPQPNKTARRFGAVRPADLSDGHRAWRLAQRMARGAPPPTADLYNTFEGVIERTESELLAHYAVFHAAGLARLHLCGAGPAVYSFVTEGARVAELKRSLRGTGATVFEAYTLPRAEALAITEADSGPDPAAGVEVAE